MTLIAELNEALWLIYMDKENGATVITGSEKTFAGEHANAHACLNMRSSEAGANPR